MLKKKKIVFAVIVGFTIMGMTWTFSVESNYQKNMLLFQNVEALANDENDYRTQCPFSGGICTFEGNTYGGINHYEREDPPPPPEEEVPYPTEPVNPSNPELEFPIHAS